MAEPLKNLFDPPTVEEIARQVARPGDIREAAFREDALATLEERELANRVRHVADAKSRHLPPRYEEALEILRAAPRPETDALGRTWPARLVGRAEKRIRRAARLRPAGTEPCLA